jgi:hypothetical protein
MQAQAVVRRSTSARNSARASSPRAMNAEPRPNPRPWVYPAQAWNSEGTSMASIRLQNNLARSSNVELKEVYLPRNCSSQLLIERNW